ncbi:hypothetical protein [Mycobacterium sp. OTB74]|uniref:hypothetical protein n=1 Tax=Mycobacterium sp. OTB74 TaxID=1853452 RepID=UPI002476BE46|nr:hypothetical protein [Mycobacterium sp. OTB74]MDH6243234.1 cytoskeletal protein RodZ [Mycobacterium sp. OTB74]
MARTEYREREREREREPERPWHERTPLVLGASIAALAAIALIYFAVSYLSRQYEQPKPPPPVISDNAPWAPATIRTTTTQSTSQTNTSVIAPSTSEIENPISGTPSDTDTGESTTSGSTTTTTTTSTSVTESRPNHSGPAPGSRPPRYNQTRTIYPQPISPQQ